LSIWFTKIYFQMNNKKKLLPIIVISLILLGASYFGYAKYQFSKNHETTDNAQIETYFVPVTSRIGGYVRRVNVADYDQIKQGQIIAEIDTDEAKITLTELEADYALALTDIENAEASIKNLNATVTAATSNIKTTQLRKEKAKRDADRDANLLTDKAISQKQGDESSSNFDIIAAQYTAGEAEIATARSRMPILIAALHKAQATLKVKSTKIEAQKLKLTYGNIMAPTSGKIGKKSIEVGQLIQPGQQLMTIVQDESLWVVANFKETQIQHLIPGQKVELKLDAYPDLKIEGKVLSISESTGAKTSLLPPDNASGNFIKITQRVPVKIEILDLDKVKSKLRAGLSLEVVVAIN